MIMKLIREHGISESSKLSGKRRYKDQKALVPGEHKEGQWIGLAHWPWVADNAVMLHKPSVS